jgi:glycosyltransferase A (GT-A) superfamily protein (DUF2064 family)
LEEKDVVIGPANNGGYYLLGMRIFFLPFLKINFGVLSMCYNKPSTIFNREIFLTVN